MTEPLNHHAALIYVMVTMSAVDRTMTDAELARIGEIVSHLPIFRGFDQENLVKTAEACGDILSAEGGLDQVHQFHPEMEHVDRLRQDQPQVQRQLQPAARKDEAG